MHHHTQRPVGEVLALLEHAVARGEDAEVIERLRWIADFVHHGSVSRTCKRFGIARSTFYRWYRRLNPEDLGSLRDLPKRSTTLPCPVCRCSGLRFLRVPLLPAILIFLILQVALLLLAIPLAASASSWSPTLLVNTESFQTVDAGDETTPVELRFGSSLNRRLLYDTSNTRFQLTDDLFISGPLIATGSALIGGSGTPETTLEVIGAASGRILHAQNNLTSSGNLLVSGAARMKSAFLTFTSFTSCTALETDSSGNLVCGTDDTGGAAGIVDHYVRASGDTMTGALLVTSTNNGALTADTGLLLEVTGTASGRVLHAQNTLASSGGLVWEGSASGAALWVSTFDGASLTDCDEATNSKLLWDITTKRFTCGIDQGGGGGGISQAAADARYVNQSGDTMTGTLVVNKTTANLVKTTTGAANPTDFSLAGATLTNVTSQNDTITLDEGTIPASGQGTMATSTVVTAAAAGAGAQTIIREDGQYIIIHGNSLATCSRWDGSSTTMTSVTCATGAVNPGAGAIALKRPDGRYLIVHGNASAGLTSLFDPRGITATAAGPAVCGGGAATTGTNAFMRQDGKYVILCGNLTAWGVYDPTANTYTAGVAVGTAFGAGAHAIMRDDGTFLVFRGATTTSHWLYNPFASAVGTMTADPITSSPPTITTGAFSIRRKDGKFLVMGGAVNTSSIYDPRRTSLNSGAGSMTAQSGVGFGPTAALADGAQAVWRQDGKYLLIIGAASTVTNIIDPSQSGSSQFTSGPAMPAAPGAGVHFIMRPNGQYQIIRGGATTTTDNYDLGYIIGGNGAGVQLATYETECMTATALNQSGSRLFFTANQEGAIWFQAKTGNGSCSGSYKDIRENGDYIRTLAGDNRIQIKAFLKRQSPNFADQEWKLRRGLGQTIYRQVNPDPTLYDLTVDNSTMVHRSQFEFGNSADPSGPIGVNIINDKDKQLAIGLAAGVGYGSTINATNPLLYNGAFGPHPVLLSTSTNGAIILRRPDSKFIVIPGNTVADAMVYDPDAQTFTDLGVNPTAGTGLGARASKLPNGKFFIILGNLTTTTNIFDPIANTFTAGPALTAAAGRGSNVIPLPNGRVLFLHGNFTNTSSIYDPYLNTMVAGPITSAVVGGGSIAIPRPDGTYFVVLGIATEACTALNTVTNNFNPYTMQFVATGSPAITTGVGPGAFAFQRSDGQWVIVHGGGTASTCAGVTRTQIYNPYTNKSVVGPVLSAAAQNGAHALPRPDGTWLVVHGAAVTTTSIYQEKAGAFTADGVTNIGVFVAGPALVTAASAGSTSFQRDDGKFVTITGNAGTVVQQYDAGWIQRGLYKSEQLSVADLDSTSTLTWKASPDMSGISAEVRTATSQQALQTAISRDVPYSGAPINPGASETWLRVHFNFKRTFPSYGNIFTDVWYNGGSPNLFPLRPVPMPVLTEFKVAKDADLVSLQSNKRPVFRVSSNGDIYTGPESSILTAGADIAERYASVQALAPGDLVIFDPGNPHGVIRSSAPYQPDVLGVISSKPGVVAGAYTLGSHPVALMGRVPVKVTDENGPIYIGDRLAASSIPGHAMKATQAARVVGMALESMDPEALTPCKEGTPNTQQWLCGTVTMFVNLSDWPGP